MVAGSLKKFPRVADMPLKISLITDICVTLSAILDQFSQSGRCVTLRYLPLPVGGGGGSGVLYCVTIEGCCEEADLLAIQRIFLTFLESILANN